MPSNKRKKLRIDFPYAQGSNSKSVYARPSSDYIERIADVPKWPDMLTLISLRDSLLRLSEIDPRKRELVRLRFYEGLTLSEVSDRLQIPIHAVAREWQVTRQLLANEILGTPERPLRAEDSFQEESDVKSATIYTLDVIDPALLTMLMEDPELLRTLDWRMFEKLLAVILEKMDYEIELTRGTKDGGIDIFAVSNRGPFGAHRYLLQAKRWTNAVGVEPVRELLFLHSHHHVTKSCLATTSVFTRGAWELAHEYRWQLELKDHERLQEWLQIITNKE